MSKNIYLNLGCDRYKIPNFINIDINQKVKPDMILDIKRLKTKFKDNSVDFIYAGHVIEHFNKEESFQILKNCLDILKPFSSMIVVVPDFDYCIKHTDLIDRVLFGDGAHKTFYNEEKLKNCLLKAGFKISVKIPLEETPYLLVSNVMEPKPDEWQVAFIATKIL